MSFLSPEKSTIGRTIHKRTELLIRTSMGIASAVAPDATAAIAERMFLTPRRHPRPTWEQKALIGARRTSLGALAAWSWGEPDFPAVLLVHGWEGRGSQLGLVAQALARRGLRAVAFDAPAHGESPGRQASLVAFADAVSAAARAFGPLRAIVAHSMGGPATLWANRHQSLAERIVLIAPPRDVRDFTRVHAHALGITEDVRNRVHTRLGVRFGVPVEALAAEPLAARGTVPLLVVHDIDDREVPIAAGESIAKAWPEATLVRTRGHGHRRILRDEGVISRVVDFVGARSPSASAVDEVAGFEAHAVKGAA